MKKRPVSISIVSWWLIISVGVSLLAIPSALKNSISQELMQKSIMPISIQYVLLFAGFIVVIISGIGMLRGHNWARFLYLGWMVMNYIINLITSPMKAMLFPTLVIYLVIFFILFRPKATEFFTESAGAEC